MKKLALNTLTATLFCCGMMTSVSAGTQSERGTIGLGNIQIQGDLDKRIQRNFDRLESERFQPIEGKGCLRDHNLRAIYGAWDALKNVDGLYKDFRLGWVAFIAGKRESRRLMGDVFLD